LCRSALWHMSRIIGSYSGFKKQLSYFPLIVNDEGTSRECKLSGWTCVNKRWGL